MAFDDLNKTYKECSKFEKIIMNIEKYYVKYKPLEVPMHEAKETTDKLIAIQKKYESLITILDEKGNQIIKEDGSIQTIPYSPNALSLCALDYLMNVERDLSLRVKFSSLDTSTALMELETEDKELYMNTVKIFSKLVDMI